MDAFQEARLTFPSMPEEVFQLWLDDRIRTNGWPPVSLPWLGALRELPLSFWAQAQWNRETITLNYDELTEKAQHIVDGLIQANFYGASNAYSNYLDDSKQRFNQIIEFVKAEHGLPGKPIFLEVNGLLEIVDGSHRLAAFFEMRRKGVSEAMVSSQVEAWVGRAKNGYKANVRDHPKACAFGFPRRQRRVIRGVRPRMC